MKKGFFALIILLCSLLIGCSSKLNSFDGGGYDVKEIKESQTPPDVEDSNEHEFIDEIPNLLQSNGSSGFLTWHPNGARNRETVSRCRLSRIRSDLSQATGNIDLYYKKFNKIFDECEQPLSKGSTIGLLTELKLSRMRANVTDNPFVQTVQIVFKNGEKLRGYLALKPDMRKRPLIIARCGVFCDITDRLPKIMIMQLFEETPFNVLVLASTTGIQYVGDNTSLGIGGYLEASQHLKIAEYLRSSESGIADRITNIHVLGLSLGANSSLLTTVLSENNLNTDGKPPITSVFSLCPVVNLEETLDQVLRNTPRGFFMRNNAWTIFKKLYSQRGDSIPNKKPSIRELFGLVSNEAQKKYESTYSRADFTFKPFETLKFKTKDEVWRANRFTEYALNTKTPTFVWTSYNDPIVPTDRNASVLMSLTKNSASTNIRTHIVPSGRHCAESVAYGWGTVSEIFKEYFLNYEPEFKSHAQNINVKLSRNKLPDNLLKLRSNEFHFSQTWSVNKQSDVANLTFQIWSPQVQYNCTSAGPYTAYAGCFKNISIDIALKEFETESQIHVPQTVGEAQAITRWLNTNVSVFGNDNKELHHTQAMPSHFSWVSY